MNLRVLIIDDDVRIAEIHQRYVEKTEGFEVVGIANTLEDAQMQLDILEPDLLLLDIFFPEGNGLEFLKQTRLQGKQVDVIPITAAKEVHLFNEALHGGVFDYILKPVVLSRFQTTLQRYRQTKNQLSNIDQLDQLEVDRALHAGSSSDFHESQELPKGIDGLTLEKVKQVFASGKDSSLTSEEVASNIGASRTTVRRYLEFLVSQNILDVDVSYGGVGRPERRYFLRRVH
ncbi:MAG: response regulator [SAR324 cluster bacterium]|jgi:response regulator of citrate/malate metabolism|nr:response regulator [SAR324 cluster bacterium]|tara:strand:+ start:308 stop:1000 length:693 start_codon:yes stop_codon:yes gene_type:complete